jgi:hypothetical protein
MHALSNADFLSLWERGRPLQPLDRGLLAIHTAFPETRGENVADWPLGRRNRALVELRCSVFGSALQAWTACPQCGEKIELNMDSSAMIRQSVPSALEFLETITVNGEKFRLPTSRDLARLACEEQQEEDSPAAIRLLQACRIEEEKTEDSDQHWSEEQVEEIGEKMAEADPLAEILLSFRCPSCSTSSNGALDLPTFLWAEIEAVVRRLIVEIHILASAYGWTEREILSLSDARRRLYLEMVQS